MKFKIIANAQTPEIVDCKAPDQLLIYNRKTLIKFLSFARRQHNCTGLAANQVSCDGERIMERFFAIKVGHVWDIVINPRILEHRGKPIFKKEGCLTWLGKTIIVERYPEISVNYFNLKGEIKEANLSGFEAQIWQHECNHLNGVEEEFE